MSWLSKVVMELIQRHEWYESQEGSGNYKHGYAQCLSDFLRLLPYPVYDALRKDMPSKPRRVSPDEINWEEFEKCIDSLRKTK